MNVSLGPKKSLNQNFLKIMSAVMLVSQIGQFSFADIRITPELCRGGLISIEPGQEITEVDAREIERKCSEAQRASARLEVTAIGHDERDCHRSLERRARHEERTVIQQCERNANDIYSCDITRSRIVDYGSHISEEYGVGNYEERKSDEATCRTKSISRAENEAIRSCESKYGVNCELTQAGVVDSYEIKKRRRYVIMGPKEKYHVCRAHAYALPDPQYQVKCSVELEARVRPF